eukprot:218626_1
MQVNPTFEEVNCGLIPIQSYCNAESNGWCYWNEAISVCESNYAAILFIGPFDVAAMSKSLIAFIMFGLCMILYWFSGYITRKLKIFKHVDSEKLDKCQIYIFELIGLSYALLTYYMKEHLILYSC